MSYVKYNTLQECEARELQITNQCKADNIWGAETTRYQYPTRGADGYYLEIVEGYEKYFAQLEKDNAVVSFAPYIPDELNVFEV
jgi:hypothetical protein